MLISLFRLSSMIANISSFVMVLFMVAHDLFAAKCSQMAVVGKDGVYRVVTY